MNLLQRSHHKYSILNPDERGSRFPTLTACAHACIWLDIYSEASKTYRGTYQLHRIYNIPPNKLDVEIRRSTQGASNIFIIPKFSGVENPKPDCVKV